MQLIHPEPGATAPKRVQTTCPSSQIRRFDVGAKRLQCSFAELLLANVSNELQQSRGAGFRRFGQGACFRRSLRRSAIFRETTKRCPFGSHCGFRLVPVGHARHAPRPSPPSSCRFGFQLEQQLVQHVFNGDFQLFKRLQRHRERQRGNGQHYQPGGLSFSCFPARLQNNNTPRSPVPPIFWRSGFAAENVTR